MRNIAHRQNYKIRTTSQPPVHPTHFSIRGGVIMLTEAVMVDWITIILYSVSMKLRLLTAAILFSTFLMENLLRELFPNCACRHAVAAELVILVLRYCSPARTVYMYTALYMDWRIHSVPWSVGHLGWPTYASTTGALGQLKLPFCKIIYTKDVWGVFLLSSFR
jgi:hypothetical protein